MFRGPQGVYDRLVEKATSQLLLEPDWETILQICDIIRQGDVPAKYAVAALKKKISHENPHVTMFALQVLESITKNCGTSVHVEVATAEFMEYLKDMVKVRPDPVKGKILELIQVWSHAFRSEASYKVVQDTFQIMKMEGYPFPQLKEADAMFLAEKAPEWKDGDCCHRCRATFSMMQRKHHCRNCGQIFCGKCSAKSSIIPKYGIEREVRVCDSCFEEIAKPGASPGKAEDSDSLPAEYLASPLSKQAQVKPQPAKTGPPQKSEQELAEEEELQLAIAISQSEAEAQEKEKSRLRSNYTTYGSSGTPSDRPATTAQPTTVVAPVLDTSDMDPELARYLNRNYWEQKTSSVAPSATVAGGQAATQPSAPTGDPATAAVKVEEKFQNGEVNEDEEQFLSAMKGSIEIFVNRMKSNHQRGRSIANDSSVQSLFMTINAMHPQLMNYVQKQEDARAHYEMLQDKLAQLKDAREALDALREDHREKRRKEQEELERQRQIQMAHKLEIMRQKKQEYLQYQRQLAEQRMQDQTREMMMRLEQQKQMQQMRSMQYGGYSLPPGPPGMQPPQAMYGSPGQAFSPSGSVEGSPHHQPHPQQLPSGQYMPMGPAPGAPGPPPASQPQPQMPPNTAPPPGSTAAPAFTQPSMGPGMSQPPMSGAYQPPGGYQPPVSSSYGGAAQAQGSAYQPAAPPPTHGGGAGGGVPPAAAGPGQPQGPPPYMNPAGPAVDYNAYNMQPLANALPPQGPGQPQYAPAPGPYMPPQQQPPQQAGGPQYGAPQPHPPPQGGAHQPGPEEAQLISFD